MKVVRRVSLFKGLQRLQQPGLSAPKMTRLIWNKDKAYRLTPSQQLFRFGYKNSKHRVWLVVATGTAFCLGILWDAIQKQLADNERETIYRYRLKEREHSQIMLCLRQFAFYLMNIVFMGNVFPLYQIFKMNGYDFKIDEKHVRYQQYTHFVKNRDNKYDFLELGVLEKFPYPMGAKPQNSQ